jgi:hypothetical protein
MKIWIQVPSNRFPRQVEVDENSAAHDLLEKVSTLYGIKPEKTLVTHQGRRLQLYEIVEENDSDSCYMIGSVQEFSLKPLLSQIFGTISNFTINIPTLFLVAFYIFNQQFVFSPTLILIILINLVFQRVSFHSSFNHLICNLLGFADIVPFIESKIGLRLGFYYMLGIFFYQILKLVLKKQTIQGSNGALVLLQGYFMYLIGANMDFFILFAIKKGLYYFAIGTLVDFKIEGALCLIGYRVAQL